MKTWDAILIGGGVIGLSLAMELRRNGAGVLVVDSGEPGREASFAAAGMLAAHDPQLPPALQPLAHASIALYPEFVHELQDESGVNIDLRQDGTILFIETDAQPPIAATELTAQERAAMEPALSYADRAVRLQEQSLDPRALVNALLKGAEHHGIDVAPGAAVLEVQISNGSATGVGTSKTRFSAPVVVNCAGAWAGQIGPLKFSTRPIKGQMLAVAARGLVRHVIRAPHVYLVPRTSGRVLIGSTLEDVGFDKRVNPETLQRLHQAAANLVPQIGEARILEDWAGLRPVTPDGLPMLGPTAVQGYFVAAGHYRDGILLAPITARLMADVIRGRAPEFDLSPFSPVRFS